MNIPRGRLELCPAPQVPEAVPATERILEGLLEENQNSAAVLFALANLYMQNGRVPEAAELYVRVSVLQPGQAEVHCNLGIAFKLLHKLEDAVSQLSQAILLRGDLILAHLELARVYILREEESAAVGVLEKIRQLVPQHAECCAMLGEIYEKRGERSQAHELYLRAFASDPAHTGAQKYLGECFFLEGQKEFERGNIEKAFLLWGEGFQKFPLAFTGERRVNRAMRKLVEEFKEQGRLKQAIQEYKKAKAQEQAGIDESYALFCRFYFSIGLLPQLYVPKEDVATEIARWNKSSQEEGYLYPHFKLGVLYTFQGKLDAAYDKLSFCRDHLPKSKQRALKLEQILAFVKDLGNLQVDEHTTQAREIPQEEWVRYGFADPFQQAAWKKTGMSPEEGVKWKDAGFSASRAAQWRKFQLAPGQAAEWLAAEFSDPREVAKWVRGGFTPGFAREWIQYFGDRLDIAVQCRSAGFSDPASAAEWLKVFLFPWDAIRWHELGFTPGQAKIYVDRGIRDPFAAREEEARESTAATPEADTE